MTDQHVLLLWVDTYRQGETNESFNRARVLRFAAMILQDQDNETILYRSRFERDMTAQLDREFADRIAGLEQIVVGLRQQVASLEGDVDEAEQTVVDLRAIETGLRMRLKNREIEASFKRMAKHERAVPEDAD